MKTLSLALSTLLLAAACGNVEKVSVPLPTGRTNQGQESPQMTEAQFQRACATKRGNVLETAEGKVCQHVPNPIEWNQERIQREFGEHKMLLNHAIGDVTTGSLIWGEAAGGQRIDFFVDAKDSHRVAEINDNTLAPSYIEPAGKLRMQVLRAQYEYIHVFVALCFSQNEPSVRCPRP